MTTHNNYSYWADTYNFGKQIGNYCFTLYSENNKTVTSPETNDTQKQQLTDIQLTNSTVQSIISTE